MSANTGIRQRLRAYFEANPDEELSKADMMVKFNASEHAVEQAIWMLKSEGVVERAIVYRGVKVPA